MVAEVEILLSQRSGIEGINNYPYFRRHFQVIRHCLTWLEKECRGIWTERKSFRKSRSDHVADPTG